MPAGYNGRMEKWNRLLVFITTTLLLMLFVAVVVRLAMTIHHTLLLFALGALVAYALEPLVSLLQRAKINRELSVTLVFVGLLVIIGLGIWSLSGHLAAQIGAVTRNSSRYQAHAMAFAAHVDQELAVRHIKFSLVNTIQNPPPDLKKLAGTAGEITLPFVRQSLTDIGESAIVLLIALYFLLFGSEMRVKFNELLPKSLLSHAELWEVDVNRILGSFVRGQLTIALLMGALAALGCLAIGIHVWLVIGLIVVIAALIPVFGPYIGAVPAIIAALIGPTHFFGIHLNPVVAALIILAWFVIINEAGSKILYPKLVGSALGLHTVLVLFVLFAGLEIDGIVGVLFAAPITALVIVTMVHLYRFWQDLPDSLLSSVARQESHKPQTHDQINHPQTDVKPHEAEAAPVALPRQAAAAPVEHP
jgi:predicted PurR-regulated permease PerM